MGLGCALYLGRRVSASLRQLATLGSAGRELPQDSLREVIDRTDLRAADSSDDVTWLEADLGGGLFKKRLARPGGGKSGGFRAIVAYGPPRADRVLVAYAFAKNAASTLTPQGHDALSKVAQAFVAASNEQLAELLASGNVSEVACDADDEG